MRLFWTVGCAALLAVAAASPADAGRKKRGKRADMVQMTVEDVVPTGDGNVVFLTDVERTRVVPISVGDSEAIAIALRLADRRFDRPLTHDLLDGVMAELGGSLEEVRVDRLKKGVFQATISIRSRRRIVDLDARASDSIALALGNRVPIYMAQAVFDETGVSIDDLVDSLDKEDRAPPIEPADDDPESSDGAF